MAENNLVRVVTLLFHNEEKEVFCFLDSLKKHLLAPAELVIWSNGGDFESVKKWIENQKNSLNFKIVLGGLGKNLGFAAGVNRAAELESGSDWNSLLLLNPDAVLSTDLNTEHLSQLIGLNAISGLRVFNDLKKTHRQSSARSFPHFLTALTGREGLLTRWLPNNSWSTKYLGTQLDADVIQKVDWVSGCALFMPRNLWQRLKGFDESYFFAVEDVDLGRKAQRAGIPIFYAPIIDVVHLIGTSSAKRPAKSDYYHHLGMWIYFLRWTGPLGFLFSPFVFLGIWARYLYRRLV